MTAAIALALTAGMAGMGNGGVVTPHAERGLSTAGQQGHQTPADKLAAAGAMDRFTRRFMGGIGNSRGSQRARGPGWTNAHAKRVARKARSVKAHRARGRG